MICQHCKKRFVKGKEAYYKGIIVCQDCYERKKNKTTIKTKEDYMRWLNEK